MKTVLSIVLIIISISILGQNKEKLTFTNELNKNIAENFDIKMARNLGLPVGKVRIIVNMSIDSIGNFKARAKAPHQKLEEEAVRVVTKFYNAQKDNFDTTELQRCYTLPIQFMIEEQTVIKNKKQEKL